MQRPWLILTFLVVVVSPQMAASSSFVLKDSGFQASSQHRIYWLDNNRVIFTGYEINLDKIDKQGRYGREQNIYIWDTRTNHTEVFAKNAGLGACPILIAPLLQRISRWAISCSTRPMPWRPLDAGPHLPSLR
ncbi:MAG: hypothetical protein OEV99_15530, partial [Nitrospira sp.]|nr:hypothetical protein [Nitrospira sp.]